MTNENYCLFLINICPLQKFLAGWFSSNSMNHPRAAGPTTFFLLLFVWCPNDGREGAGTMSLHTQKAWFSWIILCVVCMFSPCLCGFSLRLPPSVQSRADWGYVDWRLQIDRRLTTCEGDWLFVFVCWTCGGLATCPGFGSSPPPLLQPSKDKLHR